MSVMRFDVQSVAEERAIERSEDKFFVIRESIKNGMITYMQDDKVDFNKYSNGTYSLEFVYDRFVKRYNLENVSIELFYDWLVWLGYGR